MSTIDYPYEVQVSASDGNGYAERATNLGVAIEISREAYRSLSVTNVAIAYGGMVIAADVYEIDDLEAAEAVGVQP